MCIVTFLLQMIDTDLLKRTHQTFGEREKKTDELSTTSQSAGCPNIQPNNKKNRMKMHFVRIDNWLCDRGHIAMMHHDCAIFLVKRLKIQMLHNANQSNKHQTQKHHQIFWQNRKMLWRRHKKLHTHTNTHTCSRFYLMRFISIKFICLLFLFHLFACSTFDVCTSAIFCAIVFGQIHVHLQLYKFWLFFFALFLLPILHGIEFYDELLNLLTNARWWAQLLLFSTWI